MRVFVTGATGFIGSHLCEKLVEEGHEVIALVRSPHKAKYLPSHGVHIVEGDLATLRDPSLVLPEADVVVHLAGVVSAPTLDDYEAINYRAVEDLVAALERQSWRPRRLLFASSLAAAGPSDGLRPHVETDACNPVEPYGDAKYRAEQFLANAPFPVTAFRPALVFGTRDPATLTFYKAARWGVGFVVAGAPQLLCGVHVKDVVDAIIAMAEDTSDEMRTFFVANNEEMSSRSIWTSLSSALGKKIRIVPVPRGLLRTATTLATATARVLPIRNQLDDKQYRQMTAPAFVCSSRALQEAYGWNPQRTIEDAMREAWDWYRAEGWL